MKKNIRQVFRWFGLEVTRYRKIVAPVDKRRNFILSSMGIGTVLDVGANVGGYALNLRKSGYTGDIFSFEPVRTVYKTLKERSDDDPRWKCIRLAIGDRDGIISINVSDRAASSSVLPMTERHQSAAPDSVYSSNEDVEIHTLDTLVAQGVIKTSPPILLKIDVQGFEMNVLLGCQNMLPHVAAIDIELSLVEMYRGSVLYKNMITYLEERGFHLVSWDDVLCDNESGFILQADAIFVRDS